MVEPRSRETRAAGILAYLLFAVAIGSALLCCFVCGGLVVDQWPH